MGKTSRNLQVKTHFVMFSTFLWSFRNIEFHKKYYNIQNPSIGIPSKLQGKQLEDFQKEAGRWENYVHKLGIPSTFLLGTFLWWHFESFVPNFSAKNWKNLHYIFVFSEEVVIRALKENLPNKCKRVINTEIMGIRAGGRDKSCVFSGRNFCTDFSHKIFLG